MTDKSCFHCHSDLTVRDKRDCLKKKIIFISTHRVFTLGVLTSGLSDGAPDTWTIHSHRLANQMKPQLVVRLSGSNGCERRDKLIRTLQYLYVYFFIIRFSSYCAGRAHCKRVQRGTEANGTQSKYPWHWLVRVIV